MSNIKSADDLIVKVENQKLGIVAPDPVKEQKIPEKAESQESDSGKEPKAEGEQASDQKAEEPKLEASEQKQEPQEKPNEESASAESSDETDDYGNPIPKVKMYTQEQLNMIVRDRLARDRQSRGQPQATSQQEQQIQDAARDFKPDPESSEGWEQQLETFIEKTITKVSQKAQQEDWKKREMESQAEFETKFTTGMGKYGDFAEVVGGKPISNSMMLATRSMQDPAAFIYTACKNHAQELDRIFKIQDAVTQAAEIGRLEERMKKVKSITKAPVPSKKVTGDMSDDLPKKSVDQLIIEHAKSKIMNKR